MKYTSTLYRFSVLCSAALLLCACSSTGMKIADQNKPGFSNITDVPLPESATIDMNSTLVMGGGDSWTGHLVYRTNRTRAEVVDFTNTHMQAAEWTKLSELRGNESVITFMRNKRVATLKIAGGDQVFSKENFVSIVMTNSKVTALKAAVVKDSDE